MATIGRITRTVCGKCGRDQERFVLAANNWTAPCECGGTCAPCSRRTERAPATAIAYGNGQGAISHVHGCHPSEVAEYQKACPSLDIRPNGDFVMHDRVHYRRCLREMKAAGMA